MGTPATSGSVRTSLNDLQVGDYVWCEYTASSEAVGTFANLGAATKAEIPVAGAQNVDGKFAFLCIERKLGKGGLCIADRNVQHSINWNTLNAGGFIEGKVYGTTPQYIIRSISGGCAYADSNGNYSTTDLGYGAFPANNEWDTFIVKSDLGGKITAGNNAVWNWDNTIRSWTRETPIIAIGANTIRTMRGYSSALVLPNFSIASDVSATSVHGFRPVLEFTEDSTIFV